MHFINKRKYFIHIMILSVLLTKCFADDNMADTLIKNERHLNNNNNNLRWKTPIMDDWLKAASHLPKISLLPDLRVNDDSDLSFDDISDDDIYVGHSNNDGKELQPQPQQNQQPYYNSKEEIINVSEDYDLEGEFESSLPYGIQNVRDVKDTRQTRIRNRVSKITFQSLCPSRRETMFLNLDGLFEYRPDHYEEVTCIHPYTSFNQKPQKNKICGEAGFSCIQLNRTIFLTRRAFGSECWESETRLVPAGCECMWPKHHLGDISSHH